MLGNPYGFGNALRYTPSTNIIDPVRGKIFDRNERLIAYSEKRFQMDAARFYLKRHAQKEKKDYDEILLTFSKIIAGHSERALRPVIRDLRSKGNNNIFISDDISNKEMNEIKSEMAKKGIPENCAIFTPAVDKRCYPNGELAARLIGVAKVERVDITDGRDRYRLSGVRGIEKAYDNLLKGENGWEKVKKNGLNKTSRYNRYSSQSAKNGKDIYLTIDLDIQEIVEENLKEAIKDYDAEKAMCVLMDPRTGEVISMAGIEKERELSEGSGSVRGYPNLPALSLFEPGSAMKPFTALQALSEGLYKPESMIDCSRYQIKINGKIERTIKDSHKHERFLSFKDVLVESSNTGICRVADKIAVTEDGRKKFHNLLVDLGFGNKTGIGINEGKGMFRDLDDWGKYYSLHSISFGHEMSVTALQLANAYCTLANGGKVMRPSILKAVGDKELKNNFARKISDKVSIGTLNNILKAVVNEGTAEKTKISNVQIAGKTGTAEKSENGKYSKEHYYSVFAGYLPADNPELAGVIVLDDVQKPYCYYASNSAVPTFKKIIEEILSLPSCNIVKNETMRREKKITVPDVTGKSLEQAKSVLAGKNIRYRIEGNNLSRKVLKQMPAANMQMSPDNELRLITEKKNEEIKKFIMPELLGMSCRKAVAAAKSAGAVLTIKGSGSIVWQSVKPGEKIESGQICEVKAECKL